jgi:hypothetical protein
MGAVDADMGEWHARRSGDNTADRVSRVAILDNHVPNGRWT